jgi:FkbM family methyltransferase
MFPIASILPEPPFLKIIDVGAMDVGDFTEAFQRLAQACNCEVVGFEPIVRECERLNELGRAGYTYLPYVIGDGAERTFHECAAAYNSSLFEPNMPLIRMFSDFEQLFDVVARRKVQTTRLDDVPQASGADYLKIDVQGGELLVLQGATRLLRDALVVHMEAEFVPLYTGQPLFADLDIFMRSQGFVLHKVHYYGGRLFSPLKFAGNGSPSQMLWCDVVYVKDFLALDRLTTSQLINLAAIMHETYGAHDLAALALSVHDRKIGGNLASDYLALLVSP